MNGLFKPLRDKVESLMKADTIVLAPDKVAAHLEEQRLRRLDAQRRLANVDRKYREYAAGAKPNA